MKPTIGRIVHFVQKKPSGYPEGVTHLPAIITAVWSDTCVNLQVFCDGANSEETHNAQPANIKWLTSRNYDVNMAIGTWHWPERE